MAKQKVCKGCGEKFFFFKKPGGQGIPCNPSLSMGMFTTATHLVREGTGELFDATLEPRARGYVPHWHTCAGRERLRELKEEKLRCQQAEQGRRRTAR